MPKQSPRPHLDRNVFIIGAGFSAPAGLPLGSSLFDDVLALSKRMLATSDGSWYANVLKADLAAYRTFRLAINGRGLRSRIDLEDWVTYLDTEHALRISGSETDTAQGNRSQMVLRNLISFVLHKKTKAMTPVQWSLYEAFARRLAPGDMIITFNYDEIIEQAIRRVGKKFRWVMHRTNSPGASECTRDEDDEEIVLIKLHGSVSWFDKAPVVRQRANMAASGFRPDVVRHKVFDAPERFKVRQVAAETNDDSPITSIYTADLDTYFESSEQWVTVAPMLVSPSHQKIAYLPPLIPLWYGLAQQVGFNRQMTVIGFQMPSHDRYLGQLMYGVFGAYQKWGPRKYFEDMNQPLRFVDYRTSKRQREALKANFPMVDWSLAQCDFGGFRSDVLDFVFGT